MPVYNPVEVKIRMKRIQNENNKNGDVYYIGNSDMDISLLDTVIKFYPPSDPDSKYGSIVVNNTKERQDPDDHQ